MKNIIHLIITVVLSCFAITLLSYENEFHYYLISYFGPGVFFSVFILTNSTKKISTLHLIWIFILLMTLWVIAFYGTLSSAGLAAPLLGGFSSWFIGKHIVVDSPNKYEIRSFTILGGTSSLLGLILFYILLNTNQSFDLSMVGLIAFWQISMGVKILKIKQLEKLNKFLSRE